MNQRPMGLVLCELGSIAPIDINEILAEQVSSRWPFGRIAVAMGLCAPRDICIAWYDQLADGPRFVDLDRTGVDAGAASLLTRSAAQRLCALPIRRVGDCVVVATVHRPGSSALEGMLRLLPTARFVMADAAQLERAILAFTSISPPSPPAAAASPAPLTPAASLQRAN